MSTGAIFARLADAPALVTAAYRVRLAALILTPLAVWRAADELRRKLSLLSYVAVCYGSAALILWLVVLLLNLPITGYSSRTVAAFWAMALISQILGHSSYNWALKWFSTSLVAVALLGEPIGSTILAYILFDEGLTWLKFGGGVIILFAIYIAASSERK